MPAGEISVAHGAVVHSTVARGHITSIDTAAAERSPGVVAVVTHRNAPRLAYRPHKGAVDPADYPLSGGGLASDLFPWKAVVGDRTAKELSSRIGVQTVEDLLHSDAALLVRDAGLTKSQIREASRAWGLPTWDKPAAACLASRVPYGTPVTLGVRLVSVLNDDTQHVGQAAYVRGLLEN